MAQRIPEFGEDEETEFLAKAVAYLVFREPLEKVRENMSEDERTSLMEDVGSRLYTILSSFDDKRFRLHMLVKTYVHTVSWDKPEVDELLRNWVLYSPSTVKSTDDLERIVMTSHKQRANV